MSADWKSYALPDRADDSDLSGLHAFLLAHQSDPVRLSARAWRRIDTRLVQYLITAARDWKDRKLGFVLGDVPAPQAALLTLISVTPDLLTWQEAQA